LGRGIALAWLIPQAQFGLFGVALLVANVLLPLCSIGLHDGVSRYVPFHESAGRLRGFVIRSSVLVVTVALLTTVLLGLFAGPVGAALFSAAFATSGPDTAPADHLAGGPLLRASLVCVFALALYHTLLSILKGLRMFRAFGAAELLSALMFTTLAVIGAAGGFKTARALMMTYAVACVAVVLILAPGLLVRITRGNLQSLETPRRPGSTLLSYSAWAAGTAILWHAMSYYPMWYLLKVSDSVTVGAFHAVRIVTQFIQIGAVMLTAVVAANVNRTWEHEGRDTAVPRLALLTKACLLVLIAGATALSLARPVVMQLFPAAFATGAAAYDPLVLFFLLVGVVGLIAVRLNLVEKPRLACLAWLVGVAVNVASSYVLLRPGGDVASSVRAGALQAAAWALVAGVASALVVCVELVRRERLALDWRTLVLVIAAVSVGLGWPVALPVLALLIIGAFATDLLISPAERAMLRASLSPARGR